METQIEVRTLNVRARSAEEAEAIAKRLLEGAMAAEGLDGVVLMVETVKKNGQPWDPRCDSLARRSLTTGPRQSKRLGAGTRQD